MNAHVCWERFTPQVRLGFFCIGYWIIWQTMLRSEGNQLHFFRSPWAMWWNLETSTMIALLPIVSRSSLAMRNAFNSIHSSRFIKVRNIDPKHLLLPDSKLILRSSYCSSKQLIPSFLSQNGTFIWSTEEPSWVLAVLHSKPKYFSQSVIDAKVNISSAEQRKHH